MADPDLSQLCAVAVMAKAPQPGRVKTRLQGVLSPHEAAELGAAFLRDITQNLRHAAAAAPLHAFVAYAPVGNEAAFDGMLAPGTRLLLADGAGEMPSGIEGFGRVLWGTVRDLFAIGYGAVGVLNADSPTLPTAFLCRAARALASGSPAVFGPAEDGGYYFLGLRAPDPALFAGIAWSTGVVADQTRERMRRAGLEAEELPPWYDVDDPPALRRLLDGDTGASAAPFPAPATRAFVESLSLSARLGAG